MRSTVFLGLLLTNVYALAAQDRAKVDVIGVVVDQSTGAPIKAASVKIVGHKWDVLTDENGRFRLRRITSGSVTLEAEQLGYGKYRQSYEAVAGASLLRIELVPDPIVLKAVQVAHDRMRARRNAVATSVWTYSADQISQSTSFDVFDFVRTRLFVSACPTNRMMWATDCVYRRGTLIAPSVYVDEVQYPWGLAMLQGWPMSDVYLIEVYGAGAQIRVYSKHFAQRLASGRTQLFPILY
jgi:hypothetical protein